MELCKLWTIVGFTFVSCFVFRWHQLKVLCVSKGRVHIFIRFVVAGLAVLGQIWRSIGVCECVAAFDVLMIRGVQKTKHQFGFGF